MIAKDTSGGGILLFKDALRCIEDARKCRLSEIIDQKSAPLPAILRDIIKTAEKEREKKP
jgi:hypothetical protein